MMRDRRVTGRALRQAASDRNMAGMHWRTGFTEGARLGEALAIGILRDQKATTNEDASFTITRFDGTTIII